MKLLISKLLLPALFLTFCFSVNAQTTQHTFQYDGLERVYRVHIPPSYVEGQRLPLVFNLHGYGSNGAEQEIYTQFNAVADTANVIVCYPYGRNTQWNSFGLTDVDDVGFISALIDTFHTNYNINLEKVYSTGMSNGGYMSYKLACELNDRIAAVASVTGSMIATEMNNCDPQGIVPVMQIHGTADPTVPFEGSNINVGIEELVNYWTGHNDCLNEPDTIQVPDLDPNDNCTAERIEYLDCDGNAQVIFYKIDGGGHTWPDAPINFSTTNNDFNASREIWVFFDQYGQDAPPVGNKDITFQSTLDVFPNPFNQEINISLPTTGLAQISLYNALGQIVFTAKSKGNDNFQIATSEFDAGIYFLQVVIGEEVYLGKIMK